MSPAHFYVAFDYQISFQINQVKALEDNFDVKITIPNTGDYVSIRIQGRPVDTSQARAEIVNIFRQVEDRDKTTLMASLYEKRVPTMFFCP